MMATKIAERTTKTLYGALRQMILFLLLLVGLATAAHAADNRYYYPGYDASVNGCVDLMSYVKRVTVTVNGVDYTLDQLEQMRTQGNPLTVVTGSSISFNFLFNLQGRAYDANDQTLVDTANSTCVTYTNGTTYLDGTTVPAGSSAILDDSSLMKENTAQGSSYLRLDIGWLLDSSASGSFTIEHTDGNVSFYQGGENNRYLYVYFPNGIGSDTYAEKGYFTLTAQFNQALDSVSIPVSNAFFGARTSWLANVIVSDSASQDNIGSISSYGRITVKKKWVTSDSSHGPATIVLTYTQNGQQYTATRTISGDGEAYFDIRKGMTDCTITEDMTGLDGYVSSMAASEDGKTFTFTNTKIEKLLISKKSAAGSDELPGAKLVVYSIGSDGAQTEIDRWTTESTPHELSLTPGSYLLRETYAPAGYAMSTDIAFTVNADYSATVTSKVGTLNGQTLTVIDDPLTVKLSKVDENGSSLAGAQMTLTDATTGKLVHTWTSAAEPEVLTMTGNTGETLVAGHTYIMHEVTPPDGYLQAEDVEFYFNGDGTIPNCGYHLVKMTDAAAPAATPAPTAAGTAPTAAPTSGRTADGSDGSDGSGNGTPAVPANVPAFAEGQTALPTGDSPAMWVFLLLGLLCLGGGVAIIAARRKKEAGDTPPDTDRSEV